jgi:mannan endo-1,4-beta-mannosidase
MLHINRRTPGVRALLALGALIGVAAGVSPAQLIDDPVDPNLTPETRSLFEALHRLRTEPHIAFGQHLVDWASSTQPTGSVAVSDWETVTGTRPAVHEWDWIVMLNGPAGNYTVNQAAVAKVRAQYTEGAVIGMAWHLPNPALQGQAGNNFDAHGPVPTVPRLLPGGDLHEAFVNNYLSKFADALDALQVGGTPIPIIMRPYHEPGWIVYNGQGQATDGFWWNWSTPAEYKALWRMTVEYFRDTRGLNNLLWAYCPNWPTSQSFYDERYQREWIDICGADQYRSPQDQNPNFATPISFAITRAEADGKIVAYTEMGAQNMASSGSAGDTFWHGRVYGQLAPLANRISYAVTWANWASNQFYLPHANSSAAFKQDFISFLDTPEMLHFDEMSALLGDVYGGEFPCSAADLAEPVGVLNFFDLTAFIQIFSQGCDGPGVTDAPIDQAALLSLGTAWAAGGSVVSNTTSGLGVLLEGVAGTASFAARSNAGLDLGQADAAVFDITVTAGTLNATRLFFQTGSGFAWNEAPIVNLVSGQTSRVTVDLTGVSGRHDVRAWGLQAWGSASGSAVAVRIEPVAVEGSGPCSPADTAAPFGELNAFDLFAFLSVYAQGCP